MYDQIPTEARQAAVNATRCIAERVQFDRQVETLRGKPEQLHAYLESYYESLPHFDDPNVDGVRWSRPPSSKDYHGHIQSFFTNRCAPIAR